MASQNCVFTFLKRGSVKKKKDLSALENVSFLQAPRGATMTGNVTQRDISPDIDLDLDQTLQHEILVIPIIAQSKPNLTNEVSLI